MRASLSTDDGFYIVTSKDYDRDIDILSSNDEDFNASITRSIEPGIFKVLDTKLIPPKKNDTDNDKGYIKILSKLGDKIYFDTIDISKSYEDDPEEGHISACSERYYMAYSFNWPYFSYASKQNFIFILNAFNPTFV